MFGKTLKPPTAEEKRNPAIFRDVFYPRNRGRYVFRVQTAIPEVHVKTVWFEQDPTSKRWVTKTYTAEKGGVRVSVVLGVARDHRNGRLLWEGDVLKSPLNDMLVGVQQRCFIAVWDVSAVKMIRDDYGNNVAIYPDPSGKFPAQYEAIKPTIRNKPFVLELGSGQLYDRNGDLVGKSAMADFLRALQEAVTVDPLTGELQQVDLSACPVLYVISGEGKETRRTFSVITMPPPVYQVEMPEAYDLTSWPQPAPLEMVEYMMNVGGEWQEICAKFGYVTYPQKVAYPPSTPASSAPSTPNTTVQQPEDDTDDLFEDDTDEVW